MNFDDLKDQLKEQLGDVWDKIQESSLYISAKERFDDLSPNRQKLTLAGVIAVFLVLVLSYPIESLLNSNAYVEEFETKRTLVNRIHSVTRQLSQGPSIEAPPSAPAIESRIRRLLNDARLLPEQIGSIRRQAASGNLLPKDLVDTAVTIELAKLNLQQVIDIGRQLDGIHPSLKLKDFSLLAGANDKGYYNVSYEVVPLAVPQAEVAAATPTAEAEPPAARSPRARGRQ